jgi:tryptophan 2,3-dioxygenase
MNDQSSWWRYRPETDPQPYYVNPCVDPDEDGITPTRRLSNYAYYLRLAPLLESQVPQTSYVDERIFIIVHQMFELAFKELIFDLHVIVSAVKRANEITDSEEFRGRLFSAGDPEWSDAMVASRRIVYLADCLAPTIIRLLDAIPSPLEGQKEAPARKAKRISRVADDYGVLFRGDQFMKLRDHLPPASGFQSAQVRLIQRAFGKANLLRMRIFDAYFYWQNYVGLMRRHELMRVDDPLILGLDVHIARPPKGTPEYDVSMLDETVTKLLSRLSGILGLPNADQPVVAPIGLEAGVREVFDDIIDTAVNPPEPTDPNLKRADPAVTAEEGEALKEQFANEIRKGCSNENARRNAREYRNAMPAFDALRGATPKPDIVSCIENISECDDALFGTSGAIAMLLRDHKQIVAKSGIEYKETGTAGGGRRYLEIALQLNSLFPVFPVLRRSNGAQKSAESLGA